MIDQSQHMLEAVLILIRVFLFGVFALAGIGKLADQPGSEKAFREFGVPTSLATSLVYLLPSVELVIAAGLLLAGTAWYSAIAALVLLAVFTAGMLAQIAKGNAPDCHCFGQVHSEPVGTSGVIRNLAFALLAAFLVYSGSAGLAPGLQVVGGGLIMSILAIGLVLLAILAVVLIGDARAQQTQIIRRIEMLEIMGGTGEPRERDDAGNPEDALPIGAPFPDFSIPDASGRVVTFEHLLGEAKPMLFFFLGPTCNPCKALYPEITEWAAEFEGKVRFVLVSSGKAEENAGNFGGELGGRILLQKERELAEMVHAKWTPTAIFVNADGNIAGHPAVGDTAIRQLVNKVRDADLTKEHLYFASPNNGRPMKIGKRIPETVLKTLTGEDFDTASLIGRRTLTVFWSLSCPHCLGMLPEIQEWESSRNGGDVQMIIFSDGDPRELREAGLSTPIILDPSYKRSMEFGMYGTPSAVLIDENGVIVSESAIGSPNIWSLIGKRK